MNFDLTETQEMFRSTTERFARSVDVAAREKIRSKTGSYDLSRWSRLSELGLLSITAREDQGGLDGTLSDLSIIAESFGKENGLDPWLENGAIPSLLLSAANNSELLESIISGTKFAALAFSESSSRYELMPHTTTATKSKDSDSYQISGEKQFILGGSLADYLLVTAKHNDEFSLFCIPANDSNIETKSYRLADGSRATSIKLNQVIAPKKAKLEINYDDFQKIVSQACVLCCSEMLGLGQLLFDNTLAYVKERHQFGVAIGSFQVIQHGLVDCYSRLELMRSMLFSILIAENDGEDDWHLSVLGAKSFISDGAEFIAKQAVQYHGAMGITDELSIGHAMKRIILLSRLFGDSSKHLQQYSTGSQN